MIAGTGSTATGAFDRQRQREDRASSKLAPSRQVPRHRPREMPADRETETGAFRRPREVHLQSRERLEDRIQLLPRDPVTRVAHANLDAPA